MRAGATHAIKVTAVKTSVTLIRVIGSVGSTSTSRNCAAMLIARAAGNPIASNFFAIVALLQQRDGVRLRVKSVAA